MARIARIVVPRLPHHVTQRGNRHQETFFGDADYAEYIGLMAAACVRCKTQVWAYCLMPNHVHLIMVPRSADGLRCAVAETHRRYTRMINLRMGWSGHLWQERYHSFVMDEPHLLAAARYLELNPVRAGLCERPEDWPWSSARAHLAAENDGLVSVQPLLKLAPDWQAFLSAAEPEDEAEALLDRLRLHSRTGRPLGADAFITRLERRLKRSLRPGRPGPKPKAERANA
jgi:putative transposase